MPANTYGRQVVIAAANKSGGGLIAGDVCVVDTTNNVAFTTSTAGSVVNLIIGVAQETIANNATGRFLTSGYAALINTSASVTRGNFGKTHTVAKQAVDAGASRVTGTFCQFLTGGTTPDAIVYPSDLGGASLTNPMDGTGQMIYGGAAGLPTKLAAGTTSQVLTGSATVPAWGAVTGAMLNPDNILPWHVSIIPMIWTPDATAQGTWAIGAGATDSGLLYPLYTPGSTANSGGAANFNNVTGVAQNDAFAYDLVLGAGTWDCHFWVRKSTNTGIVTLQQDGSDMGTVDTYAAAAAAAKVSITGWAVAATGKKRMNFKMATKNGSSSNYIFQVFAIEFRRTA